MKTKGLTITIVGFVIFCIMLLIFFILPNKKDDMKSNVTYICDSYEIISKGRQIVEVAYIKEDGKTIGTVQFTYDKNDVTNKRTYKDYNTLGVSEDGRYFIQLINDDQIKLSKDLDIIIRTELNK